ncbi:SPFH domain-containing protein [Lentisphaerota bacterium WC36G]|nr:flotillin family protein [Lentisphaerae bacterium WC36]
MLLLGISMAPVVAVAVLIAIVIVITLAGYATCYKKCPSDRIMVIFGKIGGQAASKCIHGGAKFIWPIFQDYGYISLRPIQIEVNLNNALCKQNIRINVPSVFTVGVSTDENIIGNAAERLFGQAPDAINELARDIIFGQLRLVIASMTIEEINADRETFLRSVEQNVAAELNKVGLALLNVNITDITDASGYIEAIGKRAASEAINKAKIEVAEETRKGEIGQAEAERAQRIAVAEAEASAVSGEANADRDRRISVKNADATAVEGENLAGIEIAKSNAKLKEEQADAFRRAEAAQRIADAKIEQAHYEAEKVAQTARAAMVEEQQKAEVIVPAEIEKQQIEIMAEAEAEKRRREARGQADAIYAKLDAEARGNLAVLEAKGEGFRRIYQACANDGDAAVKMLMIEKLEEIVRLQTEAIQNIKIDKVTVWDNGGGTDGKKTATANFLSGMMQSLPPLHDVAGMAGIELPNYLGSVTEKEEAIKDMPTPSSVPPMDEEQSEA